MTAKDVQYYNDVCAEYKSAGQPDQYTEAEVLKRSKGLTRSASCDWAVYGFTVQGWLTLESQISEISTYTRSLRARIEVLEGMLQDQYEGSLLQRKALEKINEED